MCYDHTQARDIYNLIDDAVMQASDFARLLCSQTLVQWFIQSTEEQVKLTSITQYLTASVVLSVCKKYWQNVSGESGPL